jgi:hypothetical protein
MPGCARRRVRFLGSLDGDLGPAFGGDRAQGSEAAASVVGMPKNVELETVVVAVLTNPHEEHSSRERISLTCVPAVGKSS